MTKDKELSFVGIVKTESEKDSTRPSIKCYCLQIPEEGMHGTPRINALGAIVAEILGEDFQEKITYKSPIQKRVGCDEYGWCIQTYEPLNEQQKNEFIQEAKNYIQFKKSRRE